MPSAPLGLPELGENSACSSSEMVMRSQVRILPWMSVQEQAQSLHAEVLHEAETERGRENRKARGEALPSAEWLQGESQRQRRKWSRQQ